jgi:ribonuclease-3
VTGDAVLADQLGYVFRDDRLLADALTHASCAREMDGTRGNERLEFLGDAVLDLVVSRGLYEAHPDWPEGDLSRTRAGLVSEPALAERARALGLGGFVRLGRTERRSAGHEKDSILANALEALIAAIYLDGGLPAAEAVVRRLFAEAFDPAQPPQERDPKTRLNEWSHAKGGTPPRYRTVSDAGEGSGAGRFGVEVAVGEETLGHGSGPTKQAAERAAAREALARVEGEGLG